ncbi:MAG: hypothetical protein H7829_13055 [Magnetococcus sp. THC-1_WYH]
MKNNAEIRILNILVLYCAYTARTNLLENLYSFRNYTPHRIYYFNVAARKLPRLIADSPWDLIVFHTLFFARRFDRDRQIAAFAKVAALSSNRVPKVLTPQDEFINGDIVCDFARAIGASAICTVQPPSVWPTVYGDLAEVELRSVLTGYIDPSRVGKCAKYLLASHRREIDVGYRTSGKPLPWFGRHGYLKEAIAQRFSVALSRTNLTYNISTESKDALIGECWYDFLGNCNYVIGVEGGTSIYDHDGSIKANVEAFLKENPMATFEEIESKCFPGIDRKFKGFSISPRHFEACFTGTCQVLTEGDYSGILKAYQHYIPVSKDLSNIDEVISMMKDDNLRKSIVANSYRDIVQSGLYSVDRYPSTVIGAIDSYPDQKHHWIQSLRMFLIYWVLYLLDAADCRIAKIRTQYKRWFISK